MGETKSLEIRIVAVGLMTLAVVAALVALSTAVAIGGKLRSEAPSTAVTQSGNPSLGLFEQP
jgi:hypothetical protein